MDHQLSALMSHNIPVDAAGKLIPWYNILAERITRRYEDCLLGKQSDAGKMLVAVSGSQGSGKSTLAMVLPSILKHKANLRAESFSIDDVYKTRSERKEMGVDVHPLFATRGVPGTHDLGLAEKTIESLFVGSGKIPAFDKSRDDRAPESEWRVIERPADIVMVHGLPPSAGR